MTVFAEHIHRIWFCPVCWCLWGHMACILCNAYRAGLQGSSTSNQHPVPAAHGLPAAVDDLVRSKHPLLLVSRRLAAALMQALIPDIVLTWVCKHTWAC